MVKRLRASNKMNTKNVVLHKSLWQQLVKLDGQKTSQKAKCQYLHDSEQYVIALLNKLRKQF